MEWIFFVLVIAGSLALDLGIHAHEREPTIKESVAWSIFWTLLALLFNLIVWWERGSDAALNFLTGYVVERALSIDNLFIFLLIFNAFHIPKIFRRKVLFWGIFGAFAMRIICIIGGIALVTYFNWVLYLFGAFLLYTAYKIAIQKPEETHPEKNPIILWFQRYFPVTHETHSGNFFVNKNATPLFLALIAVEISDLIFALDSIPAILGITTDPYIAITSNIFAILGLRSLYFVLEGAMDLFHYLHLGLAIILAFIGLKMLLADFIHIPISISLLVILLTLLGSMIASLLLPKKS